MTPYWILILGLMHGAQPDHAVAAYGIAARTGTTAWRAAIRVALGHGGALALLLVASSLLPSEWLLAFAPFADVAAGGSLLFLAGALLLQTWRSRYVVHRHEVNEGTSLHAHRVLHLGHSHSHPPNDGNEHSRHRLSALALGLILGLGGARTLAVMLPALVGQTAPVTVVVLHTTGIAAGAIGGAYLLDVARKVASRWSAERWIDVAGAAGTAVIGVRLLMTAMP